MGIIWTWALPGFHWAAHLDRRRRRKLRALIANETVEIQPNQVNQARGIPKDRQSVGIERNTRKSKGD